MSQKAISLPFSFSSSGAVSYTEDEKKMWQDRVLLVIMTYMGERVMRPSYGSKAKNATFDTLNGAMAIIKNEVSSAFSAWLEDLYLIDVKGTIDPIDNLLAVEITYKYGKSSAPETLVVKTNTFTRSGDIIVEG
jgi:phage baseplate assembly protein W